MNSDEPVGVMVRQWRDRRRRSQLDLSIAAGVSTRHLSFIETGRAQPSRAMIERLCDELEVPLRDRNGFYLAAGLAPPHPEHPLEDLGEIHTAVNALLSGHEPHPAVAVNTHWDLLAANGAMNYFLAGIPQQLRKPRLNMLRATLHPDGLSGQLSNHAQWRKLTLRRVRRQYERTADPALAELLTELRGYPAPPKAELASVGPHSELVTPMLLDTEYGQLSLLYAVTVFGSPQDVTLDEIAIETFFPADQPTRDLLTKIDDQRER